MLKGQDILLLLRLLIAAPDERTFPALAAATGMSASEAHAAFRRAAASGLLDPETRSVRKAALEEFLVHGLKYVFPPEWSGVTRGFATSYAAEPLSRKFSVGELPPVWPHPEGSVRGEGLTPLYRSAPEAARRDPALYEWLALLDALRAGRARERKAAADEIARRLAT